MKNPRIPLLLAITMCVFFLTIGILIGRSSRREEVALSFPEEMMVPPKVSIVIPDNNPLQNADVRFPVNINTATLQELTALPGIGEGLASQIIAYRDANGSFSYVEQLMNVPGIGEKRLESMLDLITTGGTK